MQWPPTASRTSPASTAASCLRRTRRPAPPAAWARLPAAPRTWRCPRARSPARPPAPRPPPPPRPPRPPPHYPPGPAVWTCPAPSRCRTSASSLPSWDPAVSAAGRPHPSVTWREVRNWTKEQKRFWDSCSRKSSWCEYSFGSNLHRKQERKKETQMLLGFHLPLVRGLL